MIYYGRTIRPHVVLDARKPQNVILNGSTVLAYEDDKGTQRLGYSGHTTAPTYANGLFTFGASSDFYSANLFTGGLADAPFMDQRHDVFVVVHNYVNGDILNLGERAAVGAHKTRITRFTTGGFYHSSRPWVSAYRAVTHTDGQLYTLATLPAKFLIRMSFVPEYRPGNTELNSVTAAPQLLEYAWNVYGYVNGQLAFNKPWWFNYHHTDGTPVRDIMHTGFAHLRLGNGATNNDFKIRYAAVYQYGKEEQIDKIEENLIKEFI